MAWTAGNGLTVESAVSEATAPLIASSETAKASVPYSLFRRECDVLRLMVDGRTNKEIAATLFISTYTVSNGHVRHILAKLEVMNRSGVAALAVRELLV